MQSVMDTANKCRKFEANIFNKAKCQNCFKGKEDHSAEALECNRNLRKITGCGYLFVAPDSFDFSNTIDRTKRWQRRFFVLYDDGEYIYSVDENVHTVPQGIIDMNQCSEVFNAQEFTGHQYSIGVKSQDKITYIKGTSRDEINRWQDILAVYPQNFKTQSRSKRNHMSAKSSHNRLPAETDTTFSAVKNQVNLAPDKGLDTVSNGGFVTTRMADTSVGVSAGPRTTSYVLTGSMQQLGSPSKSQVNSSGSNLVALPKAPAEKVPQTYRGVRNMKHMNDKAYVDNLRKSSSLQNLSSAKTTSSGEQHPDPLGRSSSNERQTRFGDSTVSVFSASSPASPHGSHSSLSMTNQTCMHKTPRHRPHDPPLLNSDHEHGSRGTLRRHKSSTSLELEKFNNSNIVSSTAQFWEQVAAEADFSIPAWPLSESCNHLPDDFMMSRSRNASGSPFRSRQLSRDVDRARSRSRTTVVDTRPVSRDLSRDGWGQRRRRRGSGVDYNGAGEFFPISHVASTPHLRNQNRNETDEFKISKGSPDSGIKSTEVVTNSPHTEQQRASNDLMFVKKGWLLKQAIDESWKKFWCILTNKTLTYYNDSKKTESLDDVEGVIILTADTRAEEMPLLGNYAFRISNKTNEHVLSATTVGMRSSWIQAIVKCIGNFTDPSIHLQPSSLDSTNTMLSWRSFTTSDSDVDCDVKSGASSSSWQAINNSVSSVRTAPLATDSSSDHSGAALGRPYKFASTSTTFAGHGSHVEPDSASAGIVQNTPDLLSRMRTGRQARQGSDLMNTGIHNHSSTTDVGLFQGHDVVDNSAKFSAERHRAGLDLLNREKEDKVDDDSVRKDVSSGSQFRAPSTRIMERARAKSPKRARSPPPSSSADHKLDEETFEDRKQTMETWSMPRPLQETGDNSLLDLMKYEVTALRHQLDATRSQLEESQSANAGLRRKLSRSTEECQSLTDSLEAARRDRLIQLNRLQEKLSESTLLVDTQNKEILELRNKNQQLVERERNKLDLDSLEIDSLRRELLDKASLISKLESDVRAFKMAVHEKEGMMDALDRNWEEKIENAKLRWKMEKKSLDDQLKETENRLNQVFRQSESASVETRNVSNVLRDKEGLLSELQERLSENEKKLQCTLKELELEMEDNTRVHKELDEYCKENASFKMKLAGEVEKSRGLEADVRHLREEKQELVSLTSEKETKNALLQQDVERVENQLKILADENSKLKNELNQTKKTTEQLKNDCVSKAAEIEKLKKDLEFQISECKVLTQRLDDAKAKEAATKAKVAELEERLSVANDASRPHLSSDELQKLSDENRTLREKVTSLDQLVQKLTAENDAIVKRSEEVKVEKEKRILQLKCEYGELIEQHKVLKRDCQQLQVRCESITGTNLDLGEQLKEKCDEFKIIESKLQSLERQRTVIDKQKSAESAKISIEEGGTKALESDQVENNTSLTKQLKQLQLEKQQIESHCSDLESANKNLKQEQRTSEVSRTNEVEQLNSKVSEMAAKLIQLERRNRRLEQRSKSDDDANSSDNVSHLALIRNELADALSAGDDEQTGVDLKKVNEQLLMDNQKLLSRLQTMEENVLRDATEETAGKSSVENLDGNGHISQVSEKEKVLDRMIKELEEMKSALEHKESAHVQEIQALKDDYEIKIHSLETNLSIGSSDSVVDGNKDLLQSSRVEAGLETMPSKNKLEYANLLDELNAHKDRVQRLEYELQLVYQELEKAKSSEESSDVADQTMTELKKEVSQLRVLLKDEQARHVMEIAKLRSDPSVDPAKSAEIDAFLHVKELEQQIQNMKYDYEHELQMQRASHRRELMNSKDDVMQLLAAAEANSIPIDEESIRKTYLKEVEQIKDIYDKGVSNMEKSHQRTMMEMRRNHRIELDRLRQEKDQLLKQEAMDTQAALEAMKKVHESELQKERNKFLDLIAKTFSHADMDTMQRQHEEDVELLHYEMKQLTEKYSVKCLENAALAERFVTLTKSLHENRKRIQDLLARNDELNSQLKNKVERLNLQLTKVDLETGSENQDSVQVKLQVNQMEILQLREQLENANLDLAVKTEELKECMEKYHELCSELQYMKRRSSTEQSSNMAHDIDSPILWLDRRSSVSSKRDFSGDRERSNLPENLDMISSTPDEADDSEGGQYDLNTSGQLEMESEVNASRRSLWRFKNPQRARSNPSVPNPAALKRTLSTDPDLLSLKSSRSSVSSGSVLDKEEPADVDLDESIQSSEC